MERKYELYGITFVVGKSKKYLSVNHMNGTARQALIKANDGGEFDLRYGRMGVNGRITSIRAYDFQAQREIDIPFEEFRRNGDAEKIRHGVILNESQMYGDLCSPV